MAVLVQLDDYVDSVLTSDPGLVSIVRPRLRLVRDVVVVDRKGMHAGRFCFWEYMDSRAVSRLSIGRADSARSSH
jgi:hypothetical protein